MSASYEQIEVEQRDAACVITLNRPEKLNAFTAQMGLELARAVNAASEDDNVRVIILTGEGRHFCAGADISDGADSFDTRSGSGSKNFGESRSEDGAGFIGALFNSKKSTITAFNGAAVGVGLPQALKWCLTGTVFSAEEALAGGLVSELCPTDQLLERALEMAKEIAVNTAPVSVALTRQLLWRFGPASHPFDLLKVDGKFALELGSSDDVKEGVAAFLEKRLPDFPGKASSDMPPGFPWWK